MDRNTIVGTLLIVLFTILFFVIQNKNAPEVPVQPDNKAQEQVENRQESSSPQQNIPPTESQAAIPSEERESDSTLLASQLKAQYGAFASAVDGVEQLFTIENEKLKVVLSSKGGKIESVELKDYTTYDGKPLMLSLRENQERGFIFPQQNSAAVNTDQLYFEAVGSSFEVSGEESQSISFRLKADDGKYFEQKYALAGNTYLLDYDVSFVNLDGIVPNNISYIEHFWTAKTYSL